MDITQLFTTNEVYLAFIWLVFIGSGGVVSFYKYVIGEFKNSAIYFKHRQFFFSITTALFLVSIMISIYSRYITTNQPPDSSILYYKDVLLNIASIALLWLCFFIPLLTVTLAPAYTQNVTRGDSEPIWLILAYIFIIFAYCIINASSPYFPIGYTFSSAILFCIFPGIMFFGTATDKKNLNNFSVDALFCLATLFEFIIVLGIIISIIRKVHF